MTSPGTGSGSTRPTPVEANLTVDELLRLFRGRGGSFPLQMEDGSYRPLNRPVTREDYARHVSGDWTIGVYFLREDDHVRLICWDFDGDDAPSQAAKLAGSLRNAYPGATSAVVLEATGGRGYHVWIVLSEWVPAAQARAWARQIEVPGKVELFPKQGQARTHGNLVRLPLGVHRRTGRRGAIIGGVPVAVSPAAFGIDTTQYVEPGPAPDPGSAHRASTGSGARGPEHEPECMVAARTGLPQGGRDDGLFRYACFLFARGVARDAARGLVRDAAANAVPPVHRDVADQKARQAYTGDYPSWCAHDAPNPAVAATACATCPMRGDVDIEEDAAPTGYTRITAFERGEPARWHIRPFVPEGRLVLVAGEEGRGKSLLMARWAVQLAAEGKPVLWFPTEDDPADDIRPRVEVAAQQLGLPFVGDNILIGERMFKFNPEDKTDFKQFARDVRATGAKAVVMDAGRDYLAARPGARDFSYNNEADVRPTLKRLAMLAKRLDVTILFVHHFNKNAMASLLRHRITGSAAYNQVTRHAIGVIWHEGTATGAIGILKSNITTQEGLAEYTVAADADEIAYLQLGPLEPETLEGWVASRKGATHAVASAARSDAVLAAIMDNAGPVTMADVAVAAGIHANTATKLVAELEADGFVTRSGKRGGSILVDLTDAGRARARSDAS